MKKIGLASIITIVSVILVSLFLNIKADGEVTLPRCAIIIVSDYEGFNNHEVEKADQFYNWLIDQGYENDDVQYLTRSTVDNCDGSPNVTNIQSSFDWLVNTSSSPSQPVIYLIDHEKKILGNITFQFSDGNISATTIDGWFDEIEYQHMTVILHGNRSALAGNDLSGSDRDIICSMGSTQSFQTDLFNITSSLEDPLADLNFDGEVSYVEAYWIEKMNLLLTGQSPQLF